MTLLGFITTPFNNLFGYALAFNTYIDINQVTYDLMQNIICREDHVKKEAFNGLLSQTKKPSQSLKPQHQRAINSTYYFYS